MTDLTVLSPVAPKGAAHSVVYLNETALLATKMDAGRVEALAVELADLRARGGRLYLAGLGGSAANCSHAAADFRKLCALDAVALADSVADFSARANDEGLGNAFAGMLDFASGKDALMVLSVGGGKDGVSQAIVGALSTAKAKGMRILGIVGRDGGATAQLGDCVVVVPTVHDGRVTPHTEAFQMVLVHLLVSHPVLQKKATKW